MTKKILVLIFIISSNYAFSQQLFQEFIQGNWKVENKDEYEHWDVLNNQLAKGFAYKLMDEKQLITEYFEFESFKKNSIYTVNVLNQNNGNSVVFVQSKTADVFVFENSKHDFPKRITYQKINENEVLVSLSDGNQKEIS